MTEPKATIKIGGASGYWGDASMATAQLLAGGDLDYIVYDYLAEITMSIMARARAKDPNAGYASDFVSTALAPNLKTIAAQNIKVISNAGGVNPKDCGDAVRALIQKLGLELKVAVITGDDLIERVGALAEIAPNEMFANAPYPPTDNIASVNAYLGAFPIAKALDAGADIVITGRCVDSAVTLGACIHEFGWKPGELDQLAGGSLAGHIIECGPQATGGNFTDWQLAASGMENIGYPIVEVDTNGAFSVSKPKNTGGLVSVGTVAEQMLYEIGDPQAYVLPDVTCDFSSVTIEETSENSVQVTRAIGRAPPVDYKVCLTHADGFRGGHLFSFTGIDAGKKAQHFAEVAIARAEKILREMNAPGLTDTNIEVIGTESQFGASAELSGAREVAVKIAVSHADAHGVGLLLREATGLALAGPPGLCGFSGTRPRTSPIVRLFSFLLPKSEVTISIDVDGQSIEYAEQNIDKEKQGLVVTQTPPGISTDNSPRVAVPLIKLAYGRSGDKGDKANIGIIARHPEYLPYIWNCLTEKAVAQHFAHFLKGDVQRFYLPGCHAINFVLDQVLGGGGMASLRNDPQGKGYAQLLLAHPIDIPASLAEGL